MSSCHRSMNSCVSGRRQRSSRANCRRATSIRSGVGGRWTAAAAGARRRTARGATRQGAGRDVPLDRASRGRTRRPARPRGARTGGSTAQQRGCSRTRRNTRAGDISRRRWARRVSGGGGGRGMRRTGSRSPRPPEVPHRSGDRPQRASMPPGRAMPRGDEVGPLLVPLLVGCTYGIGGIEPVPEGSGLGLGAGRRSGLETAHAVKPGMLPGGKYASPGPGPAMVRSPPLP